MLDFRKHHSKIYMWRDIPRIIITLSNSDYSLFFSRKDALHPFLRRIVTATNRIGKIMASFLVFLGQFAFFILLGIQSASLASYHLHNTSLLYIPWTVFFYHVQRQQHSMAIGLVAVHDRIYKRHVFFTCNPLFVSCKYISVHGILSQ